MEHQEYIDNQLILNVRRQNVRKVKEILNLGANPNLIDEDRRTLLMLASYGGNLPIVKLLIRNGANVNIYDRDYNTALMYSTVGKHDNVSRLLLERGINPNFHSRESSPLLNSFDNPYLIKMLIDYGADVNFVTNAGQTIIGTIEPNLRMFQYLIRHSADVNGKDLNGHTALINSAFHNCIPCVVFLLESGALVNVQDKNYNTALIYAAFRDFPVVTKLLLQAGADLNIRGMDDVTAIQLAGLDTRRVIMRHISINKRFS